MFYFYLLQKEEAMVKHKKQPGNPRGSKKTVVTALSALAVMGIIAGGVKVYEYRVDVSRRTVKIESTLYTDATKTMDAYERALKLNKEYLEEIDDRNEEVSAQVIDCGTYSSNVVSAVDPDLDFSGYSGPQYVDESSTTTIIDGIENLDKKYAPYFYCHGERNDMTVDLFYLIETECAKYDLDPYVLVGLIMTESEGHIRAKNSSSTATGLCQILRGTGKFVWEDWLHHGAGSYDHSMAYNPEVNIKIGACLLGSMAQEKGLYRAIQSYRGKSDISGYCASINKYMGMSGKHLPF